VLMTTSRVRCGQISSHLAGCPLRLPRPGEVDLGRDEIKARGEHENGRRSMPTRHPANNVPVTRTLAAEVPQKSEIIAAAPNGAGVPSPCSANRATEATRPGTLAREMVGGLLQGAPQAALRLLPSLGRG
jgi:hypothetical protein